MGGCRGVDYGRERGELPDCPRLQLDRGAGQETGGEHALLAAVLDVLGNGGEGAAESDVSVGFAVCGCAVH